MTRFAEGGFHSTGMAEVIAATGLSAGAVYRYFPSKEALIRAIVEERVLATAAAAFEQHPRRGRRRPGRGDLRGARHRRRRQRPPRASTSPGSRSRRGARRCATPTSSTWPRAPTPRCAATSRRSPAAPRSTAGWPADADPDEVAKTLLSLVMGYLIQRLIMGDVDRESYTAGAHGRALTLTPEPPGSRACSDLPRLPTGSSPEQRLASQLGDLHDPLGGQVLLGERGPAPPPRHAKASATGSGATGATGATGTTAPPAEQRDPSRPRHPPVPAAEQPHRRGHDDQPDQRGVDGDRDRHPEPQLLHRQDPGEGEPAEHDDHEQRRAGDQRRRARDAARDALGVVAALDELLAHPPEQEDLVVGAEAEQQRQQQDRDEVLDVGRALRRRAVTSRNPFWKTRTRIPNVAPTESRFMRIALSGNRTDRNVKSSSR